MELSQLRSTIAVAETGNFTRAAERSHISQPSLSQQILNLEREIGHKLFHRLGRKAVLTEAGATFLERARRILFEVENAAKELSDHPALDRRITVGAVPTIMPYLVAPLIAECRTQHPNLLIHAREDFRHSLVRAVVEGDLDLAVVTLPVKDPRLSIEPILTEPLKITPSPAAKRSISPTSPRKPSSPWAMPAHSRPRSRASLATTTLCPRSATAVRRLPR